MPYKPNKGRHNPNNLREALLQYFDEGSDTSTATVGHEERIYFLTS